MLALAPETEHVNVLAQGVEARHAVRNGGLEVNAMGGLVH